MSLEQLCKKFKDLTFHPNSVHDYNGRIREKHHILYKIVYDFNDVEKLLSGFIEKKDGVSYPERTYELKCDQYTRTLKALQVFLDHDYFVVWRIKPHIHSWVDETGKPQEEIRLRLIVLDYLNRD